MSLKPSLWSLLLLWKKLLLLRARRRRRSESTVTLKKKRKKLLNLSLNLSLLWKSLLAVFSLFFPLILLEPIFICQICGKSFTQIECIDHINICKPPKSFSGSQFVMIEEDQPTVGMFLLSMDDAIDTMEPIKAAVPSSMDELAQSILLFDRANLPL